MRQLICRRTCEWLEIGYTYRAVRISYLVHLAEVAHIHTGYCKITTCYRARPDKRAQRVAFSSIIASEASLLHELAGAFLWYIYIYIFVFMGSPFGPAWAPSKRATRKRRTGRLRFSMVNIIALKTATSVISRS